MIANSLLKLHIPLCRIDTNCGLPSPSGNPCIRHPDHTGRHLFAWTHLIGSERGRVREVWGSR